MNGSDCAVIRYIPRWSRKHALFMTEFVAEAIGRTATEFGENLWQSHLS
jgi:hypothetical protein